MKINIKQIKKDLENWERKNKNWTKNKALYVITIICGILAFAFAGVHYIILPNAVIPSLSTIFAVVLLCLAYKNRRFITEDYLADNDTLQQNLGDFIVKIENWSKRKDDKPYLAVALQYLNYGDSEGYQEWLQNQSIPRQELAQITKTIRSNDTYGTILLLILERRNNLF